MTSEELLVQVMTRHKLNYKKTAYLLGAYPTAVSAWARGLAKMSKKYAVILKLLDQAEEGEDLELTVIMFRLKERMKKGTISKEKITLFLARLLSNPKEGE